MHSVLAGDYAGPLKPTRKEIFLNSEQHNKSQKHVILNG